MALSDLCSFLRGVQCVIVAFPGHTHCHFVDIVHLLLRDGGDQALFYLLFISRFVFTCSRK